MAEAADALGGGADQDIDEVLCPKALAGTVDRGERLLRRDGSIPAVHRVAAVVAIAARRMIALAEIAEQRLAPARYRLAKADQRLGFLALDAALALVDVGRLGEPAQIHHVGDAVGHPGVGRQPVASGPAGFLIIRFEVLRRVEMRDKADIGLIDAHAEGDGGDDDDTLLAQEPFLMAGAGLGRQAGMIGQGVAPALAQPCGGILDGAPGQAIDDACVAWVLIVEKAQQIVASAVLCHHPIEQVGTVVAGGEQACLAEVQPVGDVAPGRLVGGRGQRHQRRVGKALLEDAERLIVAAKIMTPLRDAMRLVDREQRDPAAPQQVEAMRHHQPLGRHVEQVELPVAGGALDRPGFARRQSGIERRGADPGLAQRVDLVLHQCDQRRDDDAESGPQQRGELVAQRFAAAGRHQHDRIAAGRDVLDDLLLLAAEAGIAEDAAQNGKRRLQIVSSHAIS